MEIILASGSPRRRELLGLCCPDFRVEVSGADEHVTEALSPEQLVARLAEKKASEVASRFPEATVIGSDTVVELDGEILGKPHSKEEAAEMLRALSGRSHRVLTGVTVMGPKGTETHCEETSVVFREMSQAEINWYVATGEPMDKAGAYGIQGYAAIFIEKIDGDYYNVMGLPVCQVGLMLRRAGIPVLGAEA